MQNPKIFDLSGQVTESLIFTTNASSLFFYGYIESGAIDLLVSYSATNPPNNPTTSDPSLVKLTPSSSRIDFVIPNPDYYPNGFEWQPAEWFVKLVAKGLNDSSGVSSIHASVRASGDFDVQYNPPTGLDLQRNANSVSINWSNESSINAVGYNIYASTEAGGGTSGYKRVNATMVSSDYITSVQTLTSNAKSVSYAYDQTSPDLSDLSVAVNTVNSATGAITAYKTVNTFPILTSTGYRVTIGFENTRTVSKYSFLHNRDNTESSGILNSDLWSVLPDNQPLYYVVTALYLDDSSGANVLVESTYSLEVAGAQLPLDVGVRGITIRDSSQITQQYINTILTTAPTLSLIPGSTVREVHIEPFSNEIQKAYFLMDFVHRAKSFPALLAIDDPTLSGTSIPVANSSYKTNLKSSLNVADDAAVQLLIDGAFDSLAQNFGIIRGAGTFATVTQTFYLTSAPTTVRYIPANTIVRSSTDTLAPRFITKGQVSIAPSNAQSYYNPSTRRWEITVEMTAESFGTAGNVPAGSLDSLVNLPGWFTTNYVAATGGTDIESNLTIAERAMRALVGVDTGTFNGYANLVKSIPGVVDYNIVMAGDPDMMRDWDPIRMKHIGGKVDIWIKGTIERTVSETFAFSFEVANDVRFDVIDVEQLLFRARDSRLTPDNPITEMLDNPAAELGLINQSVYPQSYYDLTGVEYVDYRTIKLSTLVAQPTTKFDDFIVGDYRFRSNNKMQLSLQPVRSVTSVVGQSSGPLDPGNGYDLYKLEDPLLDGESTISDDYVEIRQYEGLPSGVAVQVSDEQHVMIGQIQEPLGSIGINTFTLRVYDLSRSVLYNGPDDPNPDYLIIAGTQSTPIKIVRTTYSNIVSGSTVSVDYEHDENFAITYVVNDVLQRTQSLINEKKHITADVIVKQAVENPLNVQATVQLISNVDQATIDNNIRTNYSTFLNNKKVGGEVHVSDIVAVVDNTYGVDFVVQPFARMTLRDGALRIRDQVLPEYVFLPSISTGVAKVFILTQELPFATTDGGGDSTLFHGVFKDNLLVPSARNLQDVGVTAGTAWIIGKSGAVIAGYSDDATLTPLFVTPELIAQERLRRTANKVVVSLNISSDPTDNPEKHSWSATYIVNGDTGSKDVDASQVEYLTPGSLTLTFRRAD